MTSSGDPPSSAPALYGTDSTSRLVLLPNTDDHHEYTSDDEDEREVANPRPGIVQLPVAAPLAPSVVFLYLLSPYLRLGAIYASDIGGTSLAYCLSGLIVAATLSAFCRQVWFLLGRYLRKSSTEDIVIHAFARRHRRIRKYGLTRSAFTLVSALFRTLLAAMYLRDCVDSALLFRIQESFPFPSRLNISVALSILVFVLSLPKSLASKSVVYTTGLSIASYLAWLVATCRSFSANEPSASLSRRGLLWTEISSYTFACTTTMTVPLSASLISGTPSATPASRNARIKSFESLNVLATSLAVLLILPSMITAASPRAPASTASFDNLTLGLRIATLLFSIPSVVVSIISLPLYGSVHRFIHTDLALCIIIAAIFALSLVPPTVSRILDDATLSLAVFGTFLLPALAHVAIHYFRRPLSIVVPQEPSSTPSTPRASSAERSPSPSRDPLLQRKERLLQRSRFGKRLFWDIVVWLVLVPVCGCALVWAAGRLARQW